MIHLVETSITEEEDAEELILDGYKQRFVKIGIGKGIASYYVNDQFKYREEMKKEKFQIIKFSHKALDIINVYRSQSGNSVELLENIKKQIENGRITIITGDFNICFMDKYRNRMVHGLISLEFEQLVQSTKSKHRSYILPGSDSSIESNT